MDHDRDLGFQAQPVRYSTGERETIDRIRDAMTDEQFVAFCWGQVIRYRDRDKVPEADAEKARFYETMAQHVSDLLAGVQSPRPDPRHWRRAFVPYQRQPYPERLHGIPDPKPPEDMRGGWYDAEHRGTARGTGTSEGRTLLLVDAPTQAAARLTQGRPARLRVRPQEGT